MILLSVICLFAKHKFYEYLLTRWTYNTQPRTICQAFCSWLGLHVSGLLYAVFTPKRVFFCFTFTKKLKVFCMLFTKRGFQYPAVFTKFFSCHMAFSGWYFSVKPGFHTTSGIVKFPKYLKSTLYFQEQIRNITKNLLRAFSFLNSLLQELIR